MSKVNVFYNIHHYLRKVSFQSIILRNKNESQNIYREVSGLINPFNAEATFVQSTRTFERFLKTILTLSCWYSLDSSC